MALKIDKIRYPDNLHGLLAAPDLSDIFEDYVKSSQQEFRKLSFLIEEPRAEKIYEKYLKPGKSSSIKVDKGLQDKVAEALREQVGDQTASKGTTWLHIRDLMQAVFSKEFNGKIIPRFYKSPEFKNYHARVLKEEGAKTMGTPKEVARIMEIENVDLLQKIMEAVALDENANAKTLAVKLQKEEKHDLDVPDFLKRLRTGKLKGKKAPKRKLNISKATMEKCGFVDTDNKVIHKWLGTLVDAINNNDRVLLESACSKVKSEAKKDLKEAKNSKNKEVVANANKPNAAKIAKLNSRAVLDLLFKSKVIT